MDTGPPGLTTIIIFHKEEILHFVKEPPPPTHTHTHTHTLGPSTIAFSRSIIFQVQVLDTSSWPPSIIFLLKQRGPPHGEGARHTTHLLR